MRLADLHPEFIGAGGSGVFNADGSPATPRSGVGITLDCPCGCDSELYVPFANPLDGGRPVGHETHPLWNRIGDTFETITLSPSILRIGGCGWHGFIEHGGVRTV